MQAMEEKLAESFDQFNQRLALNRSFSVPANPPTPQMAPGSAAAVVAAGSSKGAAGDVTALAFDRCITLSIFPVGLGVDFFLFCGPLWQSLGLA